MEHYSVKGQCYPKQDDSFLLSFHHHDICHHWMKGCVLRKNECQHPRGACPCITRCINLHSTGSHRKSCRALTNTACWCACWESETINHQQPFSMHLPPVLKKIHAKWIRIKFCCMIGGQPLQNSKFTGVVLHKLLSLLTSCRHLVEQLFINLPAKTQNKRFINRRLAWFMPWLWWKAMSNSFWWIITWFENCLSWQKMYNQHVTISLTSQNWTQRSSTMGIWFMGYHNYSWSTHRDSRIKVTYPQWEEQLTWCQRWVRINRSIKLQSPMEYHSWDKNKEEYQSQNIMVQSLREST